MLSIMNNNEVKKMAAAQCPTCGINFPGPGPNCSWCGKPLPGGKHKH